MLGPIERRYFTTIKDKPLVDKPDPVGGSTVDVGEDNESRETSDYSEKKKAEAFSGDGNSNHGDQNNNATDEGSVFDHIKSSKSSFDKLNNQDASPGHAEKANKVATYGPKGQVYNESGRELPRGGDNHPKLDEPS
jgi:hypothetical protein